MILIQCTKSKRDQPALAKNLYDVSDYFCKMRAYAQASNQEWRILSGKHGLVHPEDKLRPYDAVGISANQAETIVRELALLNVDSVEVIGGRKYTEPLVRLLQEHGISVYVLCEGMEIGERKQRLIELREEKQSMSLTDF